MCRLSLQKLLLIVAVVILILSTAVALYLQAGDLPTYVFILSLAVVLFVAVNPWRQR